MKRAIVGVLVISLGLLLKSCNTVDPPPGEKPTLALKLEDVSCTEAWIELTTTNIPLPATITLKQTNPTGDTRTHISILNTKDSLLYVDSLLPNQSYSFIASHSGLSGISSNELSVTTMDTTSHNFTFQSWTFGENSSSVLYDVAIINENNIIAVGAIYMNDSLGQPDPNAYNVVRWDGSEWTIGRIAFTGGCHIIYPPIRAIWSFSENDIWFASGGSLVHYDGENYNNDCRMNSMLNGAINKIWGSSSNDLYVVGNNGTLIRFNGTLWLKMQSGTGLPIRDIFGAINTHKNKYEILCVADSYGSPDGSKVLSIKNGGVHEIWNDGLPYGLDAIWFVPNRKYIVVGDGLWETRVLDTNLVRQSILPALHKTAIRGQNLNDIIVGGAFWLFAHWNGANWQTYFPITSGSFTAVEIKNNIIAAVGGVNSKAAVVLGRR